MANHHHLTRAVEEFMKLNREMTLFQMNVFLLVATNEGQTQKWLETKMNTSNATMSRSLAKWLDYESPGKPGYAFIRTEEDPSDRRYRIVSLTPKGREFLSRVRAKLGDTDGNSTREEVAG